MNKFQISYIFIFIFSIFGIVGNIEIGEEISTHCWLILAISSFFTTGKIIYLIKKGV